MFKRLCSGLLLCVLWAVVPARAQDPCEPDCVEVGDFRVSVGLGLGMRSNPLHQGEMRLALARYNHQDYMLFFTRLQHFVFAFTKLWL